METGSDFYEPSTSSLAHYVKDLAKRVRRSDPEVYKIPFQKTRGGTNNAAKTQKCYFGKNVLSIYEIPKLLVVLYNHYYRDEGLYKHP